MICKGATKKTILFMVLILSNFLYLRSHGYRLPYLELVDMFVYFSHYFITIPPFGYTLICHKHGV